MLQVQPLNAHSSILGFESPLLDIFIFLGPKVEQVNEPGARIYHSEVVQLNRALEDEAWKKKELAMQ